MTQKQLLPSKRCPTPVWERRFVTKEKLEVVTDFLFLGFKISADGDCSHEIRTRLLLDRKTMTNLDSVLKSRHYSADRGHIVKAMVFPVVTHCYESWTIKKAECQRIDAFQLWFWTAERSN